VWPISDEDDSSGMAIPDPLNGLKNEGRGGKSPEERQPTPVLCEGVDSFRASGRVPAEKATALRVPGRGE